MTIPLDRFTPAAEIAARVQRGEWQARDVAAFVLDRVATEDLAGDGTPVESGLHAFLHVDADDVRARAAAVDARRDRGESLGPLAGVPVGIKDNISVRGQRLGCASRMLEGYTGLYDATVVERLHAADAVPIGRLNMDEFAMGSSGENSAYGPSRNPHGREYVAGGSSCGSAAAVAAGLVPLALGSDTGGSIRQPAAMCGVTGLKPTWGRVSRYGLVAFGSSLDQVGPFARSADDAALLFGVLAGADPRDATSLGDPVGTRPPRSDSLAGITVGLPREAREGDACRGMEPAVLEALHTTADALRDAGADIVDVHLPHLPHAVAAYYIVATCEASTNLARFDGVRYGLRRTGTDGDALPVPADVDRTPLDALYHSTRGQLFGREVKRRIMLGTFALSAGYHDKYYNQALRVRALIRRDFERVFAGADGPRCDALLMPTAPTTAFRLGEKIDNPLAMYLCDVFSIPPNLAGVPAVSIPAGLDGDGLPIGMQLVGPRLSEWHLLNLAATMEGRLGGAPRPAGVE